MECGTIRVTRSEFGGQGPILSAVAWLQRGTNRLSEIKYYELKHLRDYELGKKCLFKSTRKCKMSVLSVDF